MGVKSMSARRMEEVVLWNQLSSSTSLGVRSAPQVVGVTGIELHWTRRRVGMGASTMSAAKCALTRRTGNHVNVHKSSVSVAAWRLRMGEVVSVSSKVMDDRKDDFMDTRTNVVLPQFRPFDGFPMQYIDHAGNFTFPVRMPMAFPELEMYYELLIPICSRPGLSIRIFTNAQSSGSEPLDDVRLRSMSMLSGLGIPFSSSR